MFFRSSLAAVLIVLGIASPWLVRDWLDAEADARSGSRFYSAVSSLPERMKSALDSGGEEAGEGPAPVSNGLEPEVESYPFASKTLRVLQGFFVPSPDQEKPVVIQRTERRVLTPSDRVELADDLAGLGLEPGDPLFLRLFKEERELEVWMRAAGDPHFTLFKVYRLADWAGSPGPKLREGDGQSPEGFYYVGTSGLRPETRHHLGFDLGFPNAYDAHHGRTGSELMIHAGPSAAGGFALSPEDMEEVYALGEAAIQAGQPYFRVNIFPFRMTDDRMEREWRAQPKWIHFWVNLKEGYDFFENANFPPDVRVEEGEYSYHIQNRKI